MKDKIGNLSLEDAAKIAATYSYYTVLGGVFAWNTGSDRGSEKTGNPPVEYYGEYLSHGTTPAVGIDKEQDILAVDLYEFGIQTSTWYFSK